jgi:hypothetical protein
VPAPEVWDPPSASVVAAESIAEAPVVNASVEAPLAPHAPLEPRAPEAPHAPEAPQAPETRATTFADDFAQLLAFEQGEHHEPPKPPEREVRIVMPEITTDMLDQIAARVADRLNATLFGDQLKDAMTATVRATVREVVSDTSERLVRDEIDRIKNKRT